MADVDHARRRAPCTRRPSGAAPPPRRGPGPWWARRGAAPCGSVTSALATSKSWRSARVRDPAGASGKSSRSRSNSARSRPRPLLPPPERRPLVRAAPPGRGCSSRARPGSARCPGRPWPDRSFLACAGESRRRGWPPIWTVPRSGSTNPLAIPRRVDFPEPFSPTTAWTSPARQSKLTSVSARTAPNCRDTPLSSRTRPRRPTLLRDRLLLITCANISCRTSSGTSEVPETAGATRSGSQSSAVTCRITCGTTTSAGISAPLIDIIAAVTPTRDWKLPPAEYQMLYVGSFRLRPVAEQVLLVGAQRDGEVLHRDAQVLVRLQADVHPVGVLVRPALDPRVGGQQPLVHTRDRRGVPAGVAGRAVLVGRRVDQVDPTGERPRWRTVASRGTGRCPGSRRGWRPRRSRRRRSGPRAKLLPRAQRSSPTTVR